MKFLFGVLVLSAIILCPQYANAQAASQAKASYIATLSAVMNVKINDEDVASDLNKLRQNKSFLKKLQKKLNKLSNSSSKNTTNKKVMDILEKAGKDLDALL